MAPFNPQYNLNPGQEYIGYSRPSSEPEANRGSAIAIKTAGDALESATNIVDTGIKKSIDTDIHDNFDKIQNQYISDLENVNAVLDPNKQSLMASNDTAVPVDVKRGIDFLQRNQSAFTANKISKTEYDRNLYQMATSLRSKYLGYRDYVDQEIHKITGGIPANQYVNSLVNDANRVFGAAKSETEKWTSFIRSNSNLPGADKMLEYYQKTGDSNRVMEWAAYNNGIENSLKLKKLAIEAKNAEKGDRVQSAEEYITSLASQRVGQTLQNARLATDSPTLNQIEDKLRDATAHPGKYKDQDVQLLVQQYAGIKADISNHIMREIFQKDPQSGKSPSDYVGAQKAMDIVNNTVGAFFNQQMEFLGNKQFSPAYSNANRVTAITNGDAPMAVLNSNVAEETALSAAINKLNPNMTPYVQQYIMPSLGPKIKPLIDSLSKRAVTQFDPKGTGIPRSFSDDIDTVKKATNNNTNPNAYRSLQNISATITSQDPSIPDEAKINAMRYFFNPRNAAVLKKFQRDDVTVNGSKVPTQYSVFLRLTSPETTKAIWDMSQKTGDPTLWADYSHWAKNEFGKQLFQNDILELDAFQKDTRVSDRIHFQYESDPKTGKVRIHPLNADGTEFSGLQNTWINAPFRVTNNLNYGLDAMANIAKQEGTNVDAYLLKVMSDAGWSPEKEMEGVPSQIMKALLISRGVITRDSANTPKAPESR